MRHGAMDHALEARGRLGVAMSVEHQAGQLVVDIAGQLVAQKIEIDVAGAHHRRRVAVVDQGQEQMLQASHIHGCAHWHIAERAAKPARDWSKTKPL